MKLTYSKIVLMFLVLDNRGKGRDVTVVDQLSMQECRAQEQLSSTESQYLRVASNLYQPLKNKP